MLAYAFPMELHYEIYEDEQGGLPRLVAQGIWEEFPTE
jgi:hypothetical protein